MEWRGKEQNDSSEIVPWQVRTQAAISRGAPYFIEHSGKLFHIYFHLNIATSLTRAGGGHAQLGLRATP
jgi:hypothetical protein